MLLLENEQAFIDEVVPHELAHLLVWKHFGRVAPHGKEWKWMMESVLGVPARRTHQFELESVRRNTFPYRCKCQQHQLTVRRHNRVVRGEAVYRCVRCGEPLIADASNWNPLRSFLLLLIASGNAFRYVADSVLTGSSPCFVFSHFY